MRNAICLFAALLMAGAALAAEPGLMPLPEPEWTPQAAAHLLRRAGFGGTPEEAEALHALGLDGAVARLLDSEGAPDRNAPALKITLTTRPGREMVAGKSREERQKIQQEHRRADMEQLNRIREWWMQMMIRSAHPLRERMVLFWHGHFTSSYRDVRNSYHM
ncbi:MAG: DUF1800 family protein, partial [Planctomycetota bacterium]